MFDPLLAYGVSICGILVLGFMAHHNRRSGWRRRERNDVSMEILLQWAAAWSQTYESEPLVPAQPRAAEAPVAATTDLLALGGVVGTAETPAPAEHAQSASPVVDEEALKS